MFDVPLLLALIIGIALLFDFTNGAHDSANAIASVVTTRVLRPGVAVCMAALLNLGGAMLGDAVATTLGRGIVNPEILDGSRILVLAALLGACFWNMLTWYAGIPSSSSHALVGGLMGAVIAFAGFSALNGQEILLKILLPLLLAPFSGFLAGFILMNAIRHVTWRMDRKTGNAFFRHAQVFSSGFMALNHGLNDAQKTMGVIALALYLFGETASFHIPFWVKLACALAMALGTAAGGWKIVKTMGGKIFRLEPVYGVAAESSASLTVLAASFCGAPVSTTHVITASIFGVGSAKRLSAVRWIMARHLLCAWALTIPASALVGGLFFLILRMMLGTA